MDDGSVDSHEEDDEDDVPSVHGGDTASDSEPQHTVGGGSAEEILELDEVARAKTGRGR